LDGNTSQPAVEEWHDLPQDVIKQFAQFTLKNDTTKYLYLQAEESYLIMSLV